MHCASRVSRGDYNRTAVFHDEVLFDLIARLSIIMDKVDEDSRLIRHSMPQHRNNDIHSPAKVLLSSEGAQILVRIIIQR